jgi:hypothetical protein
MSPTILTHSNGHVNQIDDETAILGEAGKKIKAPAFRANYRRNACERISLTMIFAFNHSVK